MIEKNDHKKLKALVKKTSIQELTKQFKKKNINIKNGKFFFKDKEIHNSLTTHIINLYHKKLPLEAATAFFERIMKNPSEYSRNELFDFMQMTRLPLTSRGTFLAYRSIDDNWKDKHTHKIDNRIGKIVQMKRNEVDANRNNTCSSGLHFAGYEYNKNYNFNNGFLTIVEIDPKDVVSIPTDYNLQKGRCCKFKVLDVVDNVKALEDLWYFDAKVATKTVFINRIKDRDSKTTKAELRKLTIEQLASKWIASRSRTKRYKDGA